MTQQTIPYAKQWVTQDDIDTVCKLLSSANCIEFCGGKTDFIDIDTASLCMSPDKLEIYCREKAVPRVVIPVDFSGLAADLPRFKPLSKKYGFAIIEDAAHASDEPWYYEMETLGYNYRHTDFQCALALSQLTRLPLYPAMNDAQVQRVIEAVLENL